MIIVLFTKVPAVITTKTIHTLGKTGVLAFLGAGRLSPFNWFSIDQTMYVLFI